MVKLKKYILLLIGLLGQYGLFGQVKLVVDASYLHAKDTLELRIWKDYVGYSYDNEHSLYKSTSNKGIYYFEFDLEGFAWMDLHFDYQKVKGMPQEGVMEKFIISSGDSITLFLYPKETARQASRKEYDNGLLAISNNLSIKMTGRGVPKFYVKQFVDSLVTSYISVYKNLDDNASDVLHNISFANIKRKIEERWPADTTLLIQSDESNILIAEGLGKFLERLTRDLRNNNFTAFSDVVTFNEKIYSDLEIKSFALSPRYQEYLYNYFLLKNKVMSNDQHVSLYELIKRNIEHNALRSKVVVRNLMSNFHHNPSYAIIEDARTWMKDSLCLKMLDQMAGGVKGRPIRFDLPDRNGTRYTENDFKGKIVLLDFWYMSCIPCRAYMKSIVSPVSAYFKDDDRFQVVTISTDRVEVFGSALDKNDFLPERAIHLYTDGKQFKHPLLQSLGIHAYPRPFLLDTDGKIIGTKDDLRDLEEVIHKIKENLL